VSGARARTSNIASARDKDCILALVSLTTGASSHLHFFYQNGSVCSSLLVYFRLSLAPARLIETLRPTSVVLWIGLRQGISPNTSNRDASKPVLSGGVELADTSEITMKSGDRKLQDAGQDPGLTASFPYDRMTVERFRKSFPRARWSDDRKAWFVPGKTAARRFNRWLEQESAQTDVHADAKGRDDYVFEPIVSRYLRIYEDRLEVVTPYSRTIVQQMRDIPFAAWDADRRVWTIPYRSYEQLRRRWRQIEEAAQRNESDARKKRRMEERGSEKEQIARARATERRRRRYPLDADDLPPFGQPVMTSAYGNVVFLGSEGEVVDPEELPRLYGDLPIEGAYIWGRWRPATLEELVKSWPSQSGGRADRQIWWRPTLDELRIARKAAARRERQRSGATD
jgi:hypothetical protein